MSRILKVSQSNYHIQVVDGGTITLNTGVETGTVIVTGNLTVLGNATSVETTNLQIEDNIILINRGEAGPAGVSEGTAGIQIQRSAGSESLTFPDAQILFDEAASHYDPATDSTVLGTFVFKTTEGDLLGLRTASIGPTPGLDLSFDLHNDSDSVLKIVNASNYDTRLFPVTDPTGDNYIPTRKFVTDYVLADVSGTAVVDKIYTATNMLDVSTAFTLVETSNTNIRFSVKNFGDPAVSLRAVITSTGLNVDNVNIYQNTVRNTSAADLVLTSQTNYVEVDSVIKLDDQVAFETPASGRTKIYSRSNLTSLAQTAGRTGIFFSNNIASDELVAKKRALLWSILF
jgi:hypothetical protein